MYATEQVVMIAAVIALIWAGWEWAFGREHAGSNQTSRPRKRGRLFVGRERSALSNQIPGVPQTRGIDVVPLRSPSVTLFVRRSFGALRQRQALGTLLG